MLKYIVGLSVIAWFISGCAPEYTVKNIYIPPVGYKAKQCLNSCRYEKADCDTKCQNSYNKCLNEAFLRAKDIKAIEDKQYSKRYGRYIRRLNDYNARMFDWQNEYDQNYRDWSYFRDKCKANHDSYACDRANDLRYIIRKSLRTKPKEPRAPVKKSFSQIVKNEQKLCKSDCGCQKEYDICFLNCGGEIQLKKICIANCDKN
jgi:hypothetical protein